MQSTLLPNVIEDFGSNLHKVSSYADYLSKEDTFADLDAASPYEANLYAKDNLAQYGSNELLNELNASAAGDFFHVQQAPRSNSVHVPAGAYNPDVAYYQQQQPPHYQKFSNEDYQTVPCLPSAAASSSPMPAPHRVAYHQMMTSSPMPADSLRRVQSSTPGSSAAGSPMVPINYDDQDKAKLERKRLRNREAAARCRERKLRKISELSHEAEQIRHQNSLLGKEAAELRATISRMKQEIEFHHRSGCQVALPGQKL